MPKSGSTRKAANSDILASMVLARICTTAFHSIYQFLQFEIHPQPACYQVVRVGTFVASRRLRKESEVVGEMPEIKDAIAFLTREENAALREGWRKFDVDPAFRANGVKTIAQKQYAERQKVAEPCVGDAAVSVTVSLPARDHGKRGLSLVCNSLS